MTAWTKLEEMIEDGLGDRNELIFTNHDVADKIGCSWHDASLLIQSYLSAQNGVYSRTRFILTRTGRTAAAQWRAGKRAGAKDIDRLGEQTADDFKCRVERFVAPVLAQVVGRNPRTRLRAEALADVMVASAKQLVVLSGGDTAGDDEYANFQILCSATSRTEGRGVPYALLAASAAPARATMRRLPQSAPTSSALHGASSSWYST